MNIFKSCCKFSNHQWRILIMVVIVNFCAGLAYSILAPLYPAEALSKGVPATQYGFVFGIYELTNFLVAPLFGIYMSQIGLKRTFHVCMIISASSTILLSFLGDIDGRIPFLFTSYLIRVPQAIGATGVLTSSFTIVAIEFPQDLSLTFAIVETIFGVGASIGPPIGTIIYQYVGFKAAFLSFGGVYLLCGFISIIIFRKDKFIKESTHDYYQTVKTGIYSLLSIPAVALPLFAAFIFEVCTGVIPVLLEPHLRKFELDPFQTGLMFLVYNAVYSSTAPIWGVYCDRLSQPMYVSLIGGTFLFIGFILFGPAPYLHIKSTLLMTIIGLVLISLGYGANNVSSFTIAMRNARSNGFSDSSATYSLVSGAWTSSVAFGSCVGPTLAGILYDAIGLRLQTLVILALITILIITIIIFLIKQKRKLSYLKGKGPLLSDIDEETIPILLKKDSREDLVLG